MCFHDMLEKIKLWRQQKKKNCGCRGEGRIMGGGYRIFRAVKLLFCMILFKRGYLYYTPVKIHRMCHTKSEP